MQQRRWVSYIYRYREFVRCEIAGFIKVQRISNKDTDVTRIRMGMKMYKEYACTCYAYLLWHGQAKPFTAVQFAAGERDTILTSVELPWSNSRKYLFPVSTMPGFVTFSPEKNPTPSAMIARIARYRPILCPIVLRIFFLYARIFYHHSISSTGTICSFIFTEAILPLFTLMIRSAIAVSA